MIRVPFFPLSALAVCLLVSCKPPASQSEGAQSAAFVSSAAAPTSGNDLSSLDLAATGCANANETPPTTGPTAALTSPTVRLVVQRTTANNALVPIRGAVPAGTFCVDATFVAANGSPLVPWTSQGLQGQQVNGGIILPSGGWYSLVLRNWTTVNGQRVVGTTTVAKVGVGDVYVIAGQSNMSNSGQVPDVADDRVSAFNGNAWVQANDPQPITAGGTGRGSVWPSAGTLLVARLNVPIGFINLSVPGSSVTAWLPGTSFFEGGGGVIGLRQVFNAFGAGGVKAMLWGQGETDTSHCMSTSTYQGHLTAIVQAVKAYKVKSVIAIDTYPGTYGNVEHCQGAVQNAQKNTVKAFPNFAYLGPETDYLTGSTYRATDPNPLYNMLHFTHAGSEAAGAAWGGAILNVPR